MKNIAKDSNYLLAKVVAIMEKKSVCDSIKLKLRYIDQ